MCPLNLGRIFVAMAFASASQLAVASQNLTQLPVPPGVVNPAKPPNPQFPFDQSVPYRIASDDTTIVYVESNAFFTVDLGEPGVATRLTDALTGDIVGFEVSADGQWLVFALERTSTLPPETRQQLFSVPVDGTDSVSPITPAAVSTDEAPGGIDFQLSQDSQQVVYTVSEPTSDPIVPTLNFAAFVLYRAPIGGGDGFRINSGPANALAYEVAEDSSRVVYAETRELGIAQPPVFDIFSEPLGGSQSTRLNAQDVSVNPQFDITRDSARVIYTTIQEADPSAGTLVSEEIDGGSAVPLFDYTAGETSLLFEATPNGQRVVFATLGTPGNAQLRSVQISGGDLDSLSDGIAASSLFFRISEDSQRVVFTATAGDSQEILSALYTTPASGLGPVTPTRIAGSLDNASAALLFPGLAITLDSQSILYGSVRPDDRLDEKPGATELRRAAIDGSGSSVLLNTPLMSSGARIPYFAVSFDSARVLYLADDPVADEFQLYATRLEDVLVEPLNGTLPTDGDVAFALWTLNSSGVVYHADEAENGLFDLWHHEFAIFESGFE